MRVIECFAEDLTAQEAHLKLRRRVSTKTIYKIYADIRDKFCFGIWEHRDLFGGCGAALAVGMPADLVPSLPRGDASLQEVLKRRRGCPMKKRLYYLTECFVRRYTKNIYPIETQKLYWEMAKKRYKRVTGQNLGLVSATEIAIVNWQNTVDERVHLLEAPSPVSHAQHVELLKRDLRRLLLRMPIGSRWTIMSPIKYNRTN